MYYDIAACVEALWGSLTECEDLLALSDEPLIVRGDFVVCFTALISGRGIRCSISKAYRQVVLITAQTDESRLKAQEVASRKALYLLWVGPAKKKMDHNTKSKSALTKSHERNLVYGGFMLERRPD